MKNLSILALIVILFLLPLSCTETDNEYSNREPSAGESVFFNREITNESNRGGGVTFVFDIGRKSKDCKGLGICKLAAFGVWIVTKENQAVADIIKDTPIPEKYYAFLELEQPFDSAYDSTLFVEDEIIDEDGEYKVVQGVYNLDLTIGLYGGYKIDIEKL